MKQDFVVTISFLLFQIAGIVEADASCKLALKLNEKTFAACESGKCYQNVYEILSFLNNDKRYDIAKIKVLYITNFNYWAVHAVIEYEGQIIDTVHRLRRNKLSVTPVATYFAASRNPENSQLLSIPAIEYLKTFSTSGQNPFLQIVYHKTAPVPEKDGYQMMPLGTYIQNLATTKP